MQRGVDKDDGQNRSFDSLVLGSEQYRRYQPPLNHICTKCESLSFILVPHIRAVRANLLHSRGYPIDSSLLLICVLSKGKEGRQNPIY
jgi:hypothetical protein